MTIGIIGAMDEEVALLQSKMTDKEQLKVANCIFTRGKLFDREVVLLKSGIGKVNAAMATTIMHERFTPKFVINTGSAGGFSKNLEVGDVIISTQVVHHDVDATAFDYTYGQVPGMPAMYDADTNLVAKASKVMHTMDIGYEEGIIATGDSFMSDPDRVAFVRHKFPTMIAAEMEAAAVAQVCYQYNIPFVIIRALSDIAGKESSISFDKFLEKAATNAAEMVMSLVKEL
ncbi:MAG: 5'-methylthioadenosine/S-adenosylhomocysteine nucleosidase [Bacillota bacterium]|uniref:5'-methylthioadenosine/S-adenosylhomocysteine nucleosidase n=1 Tax=Virgibacillus salarius TaxID=447199 RepID=A0A941IDN9_9BACI|nr:MULTISPECIES: 5'-methylthioadenosine/S-adenosylhomocysteine nucleosidase [Bacillaceae]NAZ10035.1 5'-methylthioadenosine/S-adenosylhomocysteine nucleosidase [Agaribacter marinus]MBR7797325.1 5'-methylthioadenosine/S-adenosylhomocysteine nucleosidase [Virgibacillus salarius]MCC2250245.1 5'-methylthioadenosine/S-adenosylhomocysteine nucleosidase [Virgibacillus sp. AGTR]MDY7044610.1 5'-methylthioadenosine/S-adenosylhomocysteine nucleosidase [Virgibacillus sp. M23]QRZ17505.1 5'-methylthioadenosi